MSLPENSVEISQQQLWDSLHGRQDLTGSLVGRSLVNEPNNLAVILCERLEVGARVIEVGSANGRDARYWASHKGILVHALDISQVALDQLNELAEDEDVSDLITTGLFDANRDPLPVDPDSQNAFYARSALHVADARLRYILNNAHSVLRSGGLVAIEGKHPDDPKIKRSTPLSSDNPFLLSDPFEEGHVRRAWEPEYTQRTLNAAGFEVIELEVVSEQTLPTEELAVFTHALAIKS